MFPLKNSLVCYIPFFLLAVLALRLGLYHGFAPRGTDDQYYYAQARSLLIDFDLDLTNELKELTPRKENINSGTQRAWDEPTQTGKLPCKYPIGAPLLLLPFLALGQGMSLLAQVLGFDVIVNGYGNVCYLAWTVGNLFYAFLTLLLAAKLVQRVLQLPRTASVLLAALAFYTGPLLYHCVGDPYMAHVPSAFLLCLLCLLVSKSHEASLAQLQLPFFFQGVIAGLAVATRLSNVVFLPLLLLHTGKQGSNASLYRRLGVQTLGLFVGVLPQFFAWKSIYGSWFYYSYEGEGFDFLHLHAFANSFGTRAGLFLWNPLWLPALLAFLWKPAALSVLRVSLLLVFLLNAAWCCHWWGDSYGGRAFASVYPLATLGLGQIYLLRRGRPKSRIELSFIVLLLLLCLAWTSSMLLRMEFLLPTQRAEGLGFWPFS